MPIRPREQRGIRGLRVSASQVFDRDNDPIGELNVGRVFHARTGDAKGHVDLLTDHRARDRACAWS
jgi:hypothetical protein